MKKVLGTILFVVYAIIAITVTVLLLSYNDYNISEIGGYTVYIVEDDSLEPKYKQGSILLIKETNDRNVQVGDEIFLYKVLNSQEFEVISTTLQSKTQQGNHVIYMVNDDENYANDYFIGKADDTIVIEGWGYILSLLESRWGYLFCIVVVSLLLFLQEVFELVMEIRYFSKRKKQNAVEVEAEEEDEDYVDEDYEEDEEIVVKPGTTRKTSPSTTARTRTSVKSRTSTKASTAKTTSTTRATGTTRKAGTARRTTTATATRRTSATKPPKEEE